MGVIIPGRGRIKTKINSSSFNKDETDLFGTYHMSNSVENRELYEPLRLNNFEFQVINLQEKLDQTGDNLYNHYAHDFTADEVIRISVDSATIPHFTQQAVQLKRGNSTLKFAGQPSFSAGTIRLKDYIGLNAKIALMSWQNLSYNVETEKIGLASDYKLDCRLREYTPDYICVREWILYGCWVSGISEGTFDASSSDNLNQITATIEYDRAKINVDTIYQ